MITLGISSLSSRCRLFRSSSACFHVPRCLSGGVRRPGGRRICDESVLTRPVITSTIAITKAFSKALASSRNVSTEVKNRKIAKEPMAFQSGSSSPSLAKQLWRENERMATASIFHPFVVGLASGGTPIDVFVRYAGQDEVYLRTFASS